MRTKPIVGTNRHAAGFLLAGASLLAGCSSAIEAPNPLPQERADDRVPLDVKLKTHGDDGLPEGHPEIREQFQALEDYYVQRLASRQTDYGQALRMASLKLRGNVPSMPEIREMQRAAAPAQKYRELINRFLDGKIRQPNGTLADDPRFKKQMLAFWRNTLKMGPPGVAAFGIANQDAAPTMATMVTTDPTRSYAQLFTLPSDQCFSMDANGNFTSTACTCSSGFNSDGSPINTAMACYSGNAPNAGILGNPAFQAVNYGGLAFHRIKVIQEIFACRPHPAEPQGIWDLRFGPANGGTAMPSAPVNFASAESVVCAKCHQTMNRQAPLFANYDKAGVLRDRAALKRGGRTCTTSSPFSCNFEVDTPTSPARPTIISDYLTPQYTNPVRLGWRVDAPVTSLDEFGLAMANDVEVQRCIVNRLWYWTMSRQDIVGDPVRPPLAMTSEWVDVLNSTSDPFDGSNRVKGQLKAVLFTMLTSNDYTSF